MAYTSRAQTGELKIKSKLAAGLFFNHVYQKGTRQMELGRKAATALAVIIGLAAVANAASAAPNCGLTGKWKMIGNLDGTGYGTAVDCSITIATTGAYTGICNSYTATQAASLNESVSGTIKANATTCKLTGKLSAPSREDTIVRGGMVSNDGQLATLIGSRGTSPNNPPQVRFLILMKE
jgi:hypothetical protein